MNATEKEFNAVAGAAMTLWRSGDKESAVILDELARKMNRELSIASTLPHRRISGNAPSEFTIQSPLEAAGIRKKKGRR